MTNAQRLAEAKAAYHSLVTGTMARVVVDQNGERVEFTSAKKADLYAYIQELQALEPGFLPAMNGPVRFVF